MKFPLTHIALLMTSIATCRGEELLPEFMGFSDESRFRQGDLHGQLGWSVRSGVVKLTRDAQSERLELRFLPHRDGEAAQIDWSPEADCDDQLLKVAVRLEIDLADGESMAPVVAVHGYRLALRRMSEAPHLGQFLISNREGAWQVLKGELHVDEDRAESLDVEFRLERRDGRSALDLQVNRRTLAVNLPVSAAEIEQPTISLFSHPTNESRIESVLLEPLVGTGENWDRDLDGLDDRWEEIHGLPTDQDNRDEDPDGDGLANIEEYGFEIDPFDFDTDGDGVSDGEEFDAGTDPSKGRWPNLADGRTPAQPTAEDVRNAISMAFRVPERIVTTLDERIALLDTVNETQPLMLTVAERFGAFTERYPASAYGPWIDSLRARELYYDRDYLRAKPLLEAVWNGLVRETADRVTYQSVGIFLAELMIYAGELDQAKDVLSKASSGDIVGSLRSHHLRLERQVRVAPVGARTSVGAMHTLLRGLGLSNRDLRDIHETMWSQDGISMPQWTRVAEEAYGTGLRVAYREEGAELIFPAVTLWQLGHFSPITSLDQGNVALGNLGAPGIKLEVLERETTGYFMISANSTLPEGWRWATDQEASAAIGDRTRPPAMVRPNVFVRVHASGDRAERLSLTISGDPGQYVLEYRPQLEAAPGFEEVLRFELLSGETPSRFTQEDLDRGVDPTEGYFRVRR